MRLLRWILAVDCNQYVRSIGARLSIGFIKPTPLERDRQSPFRAPTPLESSHQTTFSSSLHWSEIVKALFRSRSAGIKPSNHFSNFPPLERNRQSPFLLPLRWNQAIKLLFQLPSTGIKPSNCFCRSHLVCPPKTRTRLLPFKHGFRPHKHNFRPRLKNPW